MTILEILVIIGGISVVVLVLGNYIYRRLKHLPTGDCACCNKGKNLVKMFHAEHGKCCCKDEMKNE